MASKKLKWTIVRSNQDPANYMNEHDMPKTVWINKKTGIGYMGFVDWRRLSREQLEQIEKEAKG